MRRAFESESSKPRIAKGVENAKTTDPAVLKKQLELGEHIKKGAHMLGYHSIAEVLALISLKKFRHLRRSYHPNEGPR